MTIRKLLSVAGLAIGLLTGLGVASAAVPSAGGTISGCINPTTGALRVVDAAAGQRCSSFERSITWNQEGIAGAIGATGAQGPAGPAGPAGPQGPAGPTGPDDVLHSSRFSSAQQGAVPACQYIPGTGIVCGRLNAGSVTLSPGTWEVTAQVATDVAGRNVFDPKREVNCGPGLWGATDTIRVTMDDNEASYRTSWTWIVTNPGPNDLVWTLGCRVTNPLMSTTTTTTDAYVDRADIIARPIGSVTSSS